MWFWVVVGRDELLTLRGLCDLKGVVQLFVVCVGACAADDGGWLYV